MEILIFCALMLIGVVYAPASASGRDETISTRNWSRGTH
jgi:hypothetical protein